MDTITKVAQLPTSQKQLISTLKPGDHFVFLTIRRGQVVSSDKVYEFVGFAIVKDAVGNRVKATDTVVYKIPNENKEFITRLRNVIKINK